MPLIIENLHDSLHINELVKIKRQNNFTPELHKKLLDKFYYFHHSSTLNNYKESYKNVHAIASAIKTKNVSNLNMIQSKIYKLIKHPVIVYMKNNSQYNKNNLWKYLYNVWKPLTACGINWKTVVSFIDEMGQKYDIKVFIDNEIVNNSLMGTSIKICPTRDIILFSTNCN